MNSLFLLAQQQQAPPPPNLLWVFIPMFIIMYLMLIKPQQKKQREKEEMLKTLKAGDKVVTIGGIHGEIAHVSEDGVVSLKIAKQVKIEISRGAVEALYRPEEAAE